MQKINIKKLFFMFLFVIAPVIFINFTTPMIAGDILNDEELQKVECTVCFEDVVEPCMIGFSCNHKICEGCMRRHIEAFKRDRSNGLLCPERSCRKEITPEDIDAYLTIWEYWYDKSTVAEIIRILKDKKIEASKPISISHLDAETKKLINRSTKACPNCKARIEKNEGCNHMTCKSCNHHFCWACMRPWAGHVNYYYCGRSPIISTVTSCGGVALVLGSGIAYKTQQIKRKPITHITDLDSEISEKKVSWLAKKLAASKQKLVTFSRNLNNKISSKKFNWSSGAIQTGIAVETFAALFAMDVDLSHDINTYLIRNHGIHLDLKHPINIALSLAAASVIKPISRLFAKKDAFDLLVADEEFIRLIKTTNVEKIVLSKEQLLEYMAKVAAINPNDVTRLEMRKKFDLSVSTIDDLDAILRICLIYSKAKELNEFALESIDIANIEKKVNSLQDMLQELPTIPLSDSVNTFLLKTQKNLVNKAVMNNA